MSLFRRTTLPIPATATVRFLALAGDFPFFGEKMALGSRGYGQIFRTDRRSHSLLKIGKKASEDPLPTHVACIGPFSFQALISTLCMGLINQSMTQAVTREEKYYEYDLVEKAGGYECIADTTE